MYDITGQKFNRLTVIRNVGSSRKKQLLWECRCDCGTIINVESYSIRKGNTKSCGCLGRESLKKRCVTHGLSRTAEYGIWCHIKERCDKPSCKAYVNYGGRGINVSKEWVNDFPQFLSDMGKRPSDDHTIERTDNDGDYRADNCKWITRFEQGSNKRSNVFITFDGTTLTKAQWSRRTGIKAATIGRRFKLGWSIEKTLTKPVQ